MLLQNKTIGLGAVRASRFCQALDPDAEGRAGVENVNQHKSEQGDDHREMYETQPGDQPRKRDDDQPDRIAR